MLLDVAGCCCCVLNSPSCSLVSSSCSFYPTSTATVGNTKPLVAFQHDPSDPQCFAVLPRHLCHLRHLQQQDPTGLLRLDVRMPTKSDALGAGCGGGLGVGVRGSLSCCLLFVVVCCLFVVICCLFVVCLLLFVVCLLFVCCLFVVVCCCRC
jgi:hypothetical protein